MWNDITGYLKLVRGVLLFVYKYEALLVFIVILTQQTMQVLAFIESPWLSEMEKGPVIGINRRPSRHCSKACRSGNVGSHCESQDFLNLRKAPLILKIRRPYRPCLGWATSGRLGPGGPAARYIAPALPKADALAPMAQRLVTRRQPFLGCC